jgi:hypothetical protein
MKTTLLFRSSLLCIGIALLVAGAMVLPTSAQIPPTPMATYQVYLPFLQTTAAPASINNGDFEQGHSAWSESSMSGYQLIFSTGFSVVPHSGQYLAWLGGTNADMNTLSQSFGVVPGSANYLHYYYLIDSNEANCTFDTARVLVNANVVAEYGLCINHNTSTWVHGSIDLSSYAGQTVTLSFQMSSDESVISNLFIDDVSFQSTP